MCSKQPGNVSCKEESGHSVSPVSPIAPSANPFAVTTTPTRRPPAPATSQAISELPPAYPGHAAAGKDDPYAFLADFDTAFLIDDSGSMCGRNWRETAAALAAIAPICTERDRDGIDVHFLNHHRSYPNLTSAGAVQDVFSQVKPGGTTPTGRRLRTLLSPYVGRVETQIETAAIAAKAGNSGSVDEVKPMNLIVITDGVASDDVESVIVRLANKLEDIDALPWQLGIQFFQVGNDPDATKALQELDDELVHNGCRRDIVDTVPWNGGVNGVNGVLSAPKILKCVLGAVVRKIDNKRCSIETLPPSLSELATGKY